MRPVGKIFDEAINTLLSESLDASLDGAHGVLNVGQSRIVIKRSMKDQ